MSVEVTSGGGLPAIPLGVPATAHHYCGGEIKAAQVSADGVSWGASAVTPVGTVEASGPLSGNKRFGVSITPDEVGDTEYWVRVQGLDDEWGPGRRFSLVVFATEFEGFLAQLEGDSSTGDGNQPPRIEVVAPSDNKDAIIAFRNPSPVSPSKLRYRNGETTTQVGRQLSVAFINEFGDLLWTVEQPSGVTIIDVARNPDGSAVVLFEITSPSRTLVGTDDTELVVTRSSSSGGVALMIARITADGVWSGYNQVAYWGSSSVNVFSNVEVQAGTAVVGLQLSGNNASSFRFWTSGAEVNPAAPSSRVSRALVAVDAMTMLEAWPGKLATTAGTASINVISGNGGFQPARIITSTAGLIAMPIQFIQAFSWDGVLYDRGFERHVAMIGVDAATGDTEWVRLDETAGGLGGTVLLYAGATSGTFGVAVWGSLPVGIDFGPGGLWGHDSPASAACAIGFISAETGEWVRGTEVLASVDGTTAPPRIDSFAGSGGRYLIASQNPGVVTDPAKRWRYGTVPAPLTPSPRANDNYQMLAIFDLVDGWEWAGVAYHVAPSHSSRARTTAIPLVGSDEGTWWTCGQTFGSTYGHNTLAFSPGGGTMNSADRASNEVAVPLTTLTRQGTWHAFAGVVEPPIDPEGRPSAPVTDDDWGDIEEDTSLGPALFGSVDPIAEVDVTDAWLEIYDPASGDWIRHAAPLGEDAGEDDEPGVAWQGGRLVIEQGPNVPTDPGYLTALVSYIPAPDWFGSVSGAIRAVIVDSGGTRVGYDTDLSFDVLPMPDPPTAIEGEFPSPVLEDSGPIHAHLVLHDPDGPYGYTWTHTTDTETPYGGWTDGPLTVYEQRPYGPVAAGTLSRVVDAVDERHVTYTFAPQPDWYGTVSFAIKGHDGTSSVVRVFTVTVDPVPDPPGNLTPLSFHTSEDTPTAGTFTWTDPDHRPDLPGRWALQLADPATPTVWRDLELNYEYGQWILTPGDTTVPACGYTYAPAAHYHGAHTVLARIVDLDSEDPSDPDIVSPTYTLTVTVDPVDDVPGDPYPLRMPTIEIDGVSQREFYTVDPDGGPWTWRVRPAGSSGSGASSTAIPGGTVTVVTSPSSTPETTVRFTPSPGWSGKYRFQLRVTDSTSLSSNWVTVSGVVAPPPMTAELYRTTHTTAGFSRTLLGRVDLAGMEWTEAQDVGGGAAGVTARIATAQLKVLADAAGKTLRRFLDPNATELDLWVDGHVVFSGPLKYPAQEASGLWTEVEFLDLGVYTERMHATETATPRSFVGVEQSQIMWTLVDEAQSRAYGSWGLADGTVNTSQNRTMEFEPGVTVSAALRDVSGQLDGPEWWVDPDRTFRTAVIRGADRRGEVVFSERNTLGVEWEAEDERFTTVSVVDGTDHTGTATAGTSALSRWGRFVRRFRTQLDTQMGVDLLAAQHADTWGTLPARTMTVTHWVSLDSPIRVTDYAVGDAVTVDADTPDGRVTADVRIIKRVVEAVGDTGRDFRVTIEAEEIASDGVIRPARSRYSPDVYDRIFDFQLGGR